MTHLVMINAGRTGMMTASSLLDQGFDLSFIDSVQFREYEENTVNNSIKSRIKNCYNLDNTDDKDALFSLINKIGSKKKIDGIICTLEYSMESTAYVAEKLNLTFTPHDAVIKCRNKDQTRCILDEYGIKNAKFIKVISNNELLSGAKYIGYPLIIKPVTSGSSVGTALVVSEENLNKAWESINQEIRKASKAMQEQYLRGFVLEEYLEGKMISVEIAENFGEVCVFMISGRERSKINEIVEYRIDMPADITAYEWKICEAYSKAIVSALGLKNGIFHLEIILTTSGPVLVEVNPRIMGSYMPYLYMALTGNPINRWLADISCGKKVNITPFKYEDKIASAIRFDSIVDGYYRPDMFRDLVNKYFDILYSELPYGDEMIRVDAGETLGRIQIIEESHANVEYKLNNFFNAVREDLGLELLR
ncbi:acetyl-CoA carboxylase biotin carboxylase subunit family protein [Enterobacteriaceae bacterium LUAb1]